MPRSLSHFYFAPWNIHLFVSLTQHGKIITIKVKWQTLKSVISPVGQLEKRDIEVNETPQINYINLSQVYVLYLSTHPHMWWQRRTCDNTFTHVIKHLHMWLHVVCQNFDATNISTSFNSISEKSLVVRRNVVQRFRDWFSSGAYIYIFTALSF